VPDDEHSDDTRHRSNVVTLPRTNVVTLPRTNVDTFPRSTGGTFPRATEGTLQRVDTSGPQPKPICPQCRQSEALLAAQSARLNAALVELESMKALKKLLRAVWSTLDKDAQREVLRRVFGERAGR
jgi:hypothetical protein